MFSLFKKACLLYKTSKIIFHHLLSRSMKWEYRGLKGVLGVRRGYKELQGVKSGSKKLQGVTRGDKEWQGVTKDYTNFFLTRTFPDTFSWSILHKNQSGRNLDLFLINTKDKKTSTFWPNGLSPLKKGQFCLLFKSMFILSRKSSFLTRTSPNTFSGFILHNTKRSKNFQFLKKTID